MIRSSFSTRRLILMARRCKLSTAALLCPGQGSQYIGMFRRTGKLSDDLLNGQSEYLKEIIDIGNVGPQAVLDKTINCQPAVVLSTMLAFEKFKERIDECEVDCVAGYSVGEIPALYVAGCLSFRDVMRVIRKRAEAMQHASDLKETGMLTVQGLTFQRANELCADLNTTSDMERISVAIEMYSRSVVLGGSAPMLNRVIGREHSLIKDETSIKISSVPVSGAFHTPYMRFAQDDLQRALESVEWLPSDTCLYSNVTGQPYTRKCNKIELLVRQLCETVKWSDILTDVSKKFDQGLVSKLVELGPGKQLKTMVSKINRKAIRCTETLEL